jgi:hypothetical protein
MKRDRDDLRRLHFINALFAHATGHDLYLAEQIRSAIAFNLEEFAERAATDTLPTGVSEAAFNAAAADLLALLSGNRPRHGFFHWDAALTITSAMPLFTRAEIMAGLRRLAPFREATLLVTNLRPALLPAGRRRTLRRQRDYAEALAFIRDLTAARTSREGNLQLLFL